MTSLIQCRYRRTEQSTVQANSLLLNPHQLTPPCTWRSQQKLALYMYTMYLNSVLILRYTSIFINYTFSKWRQFHNCVIPAGPMQPILYMKICINCNSRFMTFRKIIRIPNLILTIPNYLSWLSLNWSVSWFAFVQHLHFLSYPVARECQGNIRGRNVQGDNVRSPVYWCGQQNSATVSCITSTTVERVAAECTMHAANHSIEVTDIVTVRFIGYDFLSIFNKIIHRHIFNLLCDKQAISRKCEFFLPCVYLVNSVSMTPLLYLIKII